MSFALVYGHGFAARRRGPGLTYHAATAKKDPSPVRCHYNYPTSIYFAVRENQVKAAALSLDCGGDPLNLAVNDTPPTVTGDRGYTEMRRLPAVHRDGRGEGIAAAIREKKLRKVRKLLDGSPDFIHTSDERGNQPIYWAVMARPIQLTNGDYLYRGWRDVPASTKTKPRDVLSHLRKRGAYRDICTASYIGDLERVQELLREDAALVNRPSDYATYYACSGPPPRMAAAGVGATTTAERLRGDEALSLRAGGTRS
ncbi:MAG: hypothetical protein ACKV2U_20360 [Bryobacteraceae bacterium]